MVPLQDNRSGTDRGRKAAFAHGVPGIFVQACFYPERLAPAAPVPAAAGEEQRPVPRRQGTGTPPGRCLLAVGFRVFCDFAKKIAENFIGQHFVDLACFVRNHGYNFWQRRRIFVPILAFLWDRRGAVLRWYSKNVFTTGTKCCIMFNNSVPAAAQAAPGGRAPGAGAAALCRPLSQAAEHSAAATARYGMAGPACRACPIRRFMLEPKTKEHIRRWFLHHLPKYGTLAASLAVLLGVIAVTSSQLQVVTVSDSHGKSATVVSAEHEVVALIAQAGITPSSTADELVVTETDDNNSIHILRAFDVPVTVDGRTVDVVTTGGTVEEVLRDGGIQLSEDDETEPARGETVEEGQSITVHRVTYDTYTVQETVPAEVVTEYTSLFYRQQDYELVLQQGADGLDEVTYRDKYVDGQLAETTEVSRTTLVGMVQHIVKQYGEAVPVSDFAGPEIVDGQPAEGVVQVYTGQRSTGYSASATAKGASGRRLSYGTVAVNPNVIPYGTLLYITSDDGRFVYGYAYAADTGTAMLTGHAFIDLYYETYEESVKNAVIPVTVYVIDDEVAAQYEEENDALLDAILAERGLEDE